MLRTSLRSVSLLGHSRPSIICLNFTLQIYFPKVTHTHRGRLRAGCATVTQKLRSHRLCTKHDLIQLHEGVLRLNQGVCLHPVWPAKSHPVYPTQSAKPLLSVLLARIAAISAFHGPERHFKILTQSNIGLSSFYSAKILFKSTIKINLLKKNFYNSKDIFSE